MKWSRKLCMQSPAQPGPVRSATEKSFFRALTRRFEFAMTNVARACSECAEKTLDSHRLWKDHEFTRAASRSNIIARGGCQPNDHGGHRSQRVTRSLRTGIRCHRA